MKLAIDGTRVEITRGRESAHRSFAAADPQPPAPDTQRPAPAYHEVIAPSVGVFHRAPAPDARPLEPGDRVEPDDVVGVVHVMKRTLEVMAGASGTVRSIHAEDGEPVEYGRLLFTIAAHQ
jgi:biotin carboxyl carrier protein